MHLKATVEPPSSEPPSPSEADALLPDAGSAHRIVRLAARALGAPAAALWLSSSPLPRLASASGLSSLPEPLDAEPSALDLTIDGVFISSDLSVDRDSRAQQLARIAPRVRGAAVAPVRGADGRLVGVLAVLDIEARAFDADDEAALADHAVLLGEALERGRIAARSEELRLATERLTRELEERRRTAEQYRTLIHNFPDVTVMLLDRDLRFIIADGRSLTDAGTEQLIGKALVEVVAPSTYERVEPLYRAAFEGQSSVAEIRNGERVYLGHIGPVRREDGAIVAAMLVAQDITSRVLAEALLRESEERYRLLFERAGEAILIMTVNEEGRIVEANTAAAVMHGYAVNELKGMSLVDLDAPEVALDTHSNIRRIGDGEWIAGETVHLRRDGTRFPIEYSAGPLDVGNRRLLITFMRDVTERKRVEEALRQAKDTADAASRAKSAFLANMSHEIRTPMNAILGYTQLLQRDPKMTPDQRQSVEVISRSGEHLLGLINDVLEMSKIEAGYRRVTRAEVDLTALLDDLERMFRLRADAKRLTFEIHRAPSLPCMVLVDEGKLRQMLVNLLGNAVKFTARGGVTARVVVERRDSGEATLRVTIEDTGPGIGPEEVRGLFRPFAQARVGIQAQGGTGLGLALSREFARLMGGDITVQSRPGEGSAFRLEIPIEISTGIQPELPPTPRGRVVSVADTDRCIRILMVDDDDDNRSWTRRLLAQVGFDICEASNGIEALARFDEWRPHLVLMDMHMPAMDGYAATRAIRARPSGRSTAIVPVTASAFDEERDAIFAAGADGWLRKPCRQGDLLEEIRKQLDLEYHYADEPETDRTSQLPDLTTRREEYVQGLPPHLVGALRQAAHVADYEGLMRLLDKLPPEHTLVAEALRELVERYEYDAIEAILAT